MSNQTVMYFPLVILTRLFSHTLLMQQRTCLSKQDNTLGSRLENTNAHGAQHCVPSGKPWLSISNQGMGRCTTSWRLTPWIHASGSGNHQCRPWENQGAVWAPCRHWGSGIINKRILRNICKVREWTAHYKECPGACFPARLCCLRPWRLSKPDWIEPRASWSDLKAELVQSRRLA